MKASLFTLNRNILKIIALVCMTIDHIGFIMFPKMILFRIIGRIAFPIFSYMICEGYYYTRNKLKYSLTILTLGVIFQIVYALMVNPLYLNIFLTYSLSILLMYGIDCFKNKKGVLRYLIVPFIIFSFIISEGIRLAFPNIQLTVDYGFIGVIIPVLLYLTDNKYIKMSILFVSLLLLSFVSKGIQYTCLLALPLLLLYNGKKGKLNLKYFFYIYYPLHLVVIYLIQELLI